MKNPFLILTLCFFIFGCDSKNQKTERKTVEIKKEKNTNKLKESISPITNDLEKTKLCDCKIEKYSRNYGADLIFQNSEHAKAKNDSLFSKWSKETLINEIKSIRFSGYDTIPKKYAIFKEVNKLSISNRNGIYGLDIFPKLKTIHFFGSIINLNTNEKWLNKIEALIGQKTKFTGLESFTKMPNLNIIYFGFSGFDNFPKDLDKLECLNELTLGAYMFGKIDLAKLDLSKNKCLQKAEFQCWQNTLSGIPKGLSNSNIRKLKVNHQKLTELEKKELKSIKASW